MEVQQILTERTEDRGDTNDSKDSKDADGSCTNTILSWGDNIKNTNNRVRKSDKLKNMAKIDKVEKIDEILETFNRLDTSIRQHSIRMYLILHKFFKERASIGNLDGEANIYKKLQCAAMLHDIGKVYISNHNIWRKEGKFNNIEFNIKDLHSYFGYALLKELGVDSDICNMILYHHLNTNEILIPGLIDIQDKFENLPKNIKESIIILRTVDIFDARASERAYKQAESYSEILYDMKKEFRGYKTASGRIVKDVNISIEMIDFLERGIKYYCSDVFTKEAVEIQKSSYSLGITKASSVVDRILAEIITDYSEN